MANALKMQLRCPESTQSDFRKDRTELNILENYENIRSIISVNTNILLRRFRLKFLRTMYSISCCKERRNFENTLYTPQMKE
jgi:hypothetical protein